MQRKNVNPFIIHFLYLLSFPSLSMCHFCLVWVRKEKSERVSERQGEMETMSRTFDSIVLFSIIVVYFFFGCVCARMYRLYTLTIWPSWAARFAPAINSNGWIGRHLSLLFLCVLFFFQSSILWSTCMYRYLYPRFRQRFRLTEFFSRPFNRCCCVFFVYHSNTFHMNENR